MVNVTLSKEDAFGLLNMLDIWTSELYKYKDNERLEASLWALQKSLEAERCKIAIANALNTEEAP